MNTEKPKILVVDDVPTDIEELSKLLSGEFKVDGAADGPEALAKAVATTPDLILLDTFMPGMNGFEVCHRLKEDERTQNIPVIFITSLSEEQNEAKGLELGAADYITKPFRLPVVVARIKNNIELKRRGDLLEELAMLDGLTKLPNQRSFEKALNTEWLRGQRSQEPLSLILCDLDDFMQYNDHFGHAMGDACLSKIGKMLTGFASRASDLAARIGGEKFGLVLPATSRDGALIMAESIRSSIEGKNIPHAPSCLRDNLTLSFGVATVTPSRESTPEALFEAADKALHEAKTTGRNQVVAAAEYKKIFG